VIAFKLSLVKVLFDEEKFIVNDLRDPFAISVEYEAIDTDFLVTCYTDALYQLFFVADRRKR